MLSAVKMENGVNPKKLPRLRKANFSPLEESILEREVEKNFDVLKEKHTNFVNNVKKARIWSEITIKINALGVAPRTLKEVKDKWRNMISKSKSNFTECRKEVNKTDGGPTPKIPTSSVARIVNMMQDTASLSGIEGGLETAGFSNEQKADQVILLVRLIFVLVVDKCYCRALVFLFAGPCVDQNIYEESDCSLSQDHFSTKDTSSGLSPTQAPAQPVEAIVYVNNPAVPTMQTKGSKGVKRKRASHEDVLDLQVKVLKGKLEEQKLNKLKLQLQIDMLKKYSSNEYTLSSSQTALLSSMI